MLYTAACALAHFIANAIFSQREMHLGSIPTSLVHILLLYMSDVSASVHLVVPYVSHAMWSNEKRIILRVSKSIYMLFTRGRAWAYFYCKTDVASRESCRDHDREGRWDVGGKSTEINAEPGILLLIERMSMNVFGRIVSQRKREGIFQVLMRWRMPFLLLLVRREGGWRELWDRFCLPGSRAP